MTASEQLRSILCCFDEVVFRSVEGQQKVMKAIDQVELLEKRYEDICCRIYRKIQEAEK